MKKTTLQCKRGFLDFEKITFNVKKWRYIPSRNLQDYTRNIWRFSVMVVRQFILETIVINSIVIQQL